MQTCTRCSTQSPDQVDICPTCGANLALSSETAVALQKFQANSRVQYVRIAVNHDCCPACRAVEGAYPKDQVPTLPTPGCSHALGCRCFYQPFLDDLYP